MMDSQSESSARVRVWVNGEPRSSAARTLAELIAESGFAEAKVATAINGDFVPERARTSRLISEGDRVEIVSPRQGG